MAEEIYPAILNIPEPVKPTQPPPRQPVYDPPEVGINESGGYLSIDPDDDISREAYLSGKLEQSVAPTFGRKFIDQARENLRTVGFGITGEGSLSQGASELLQYYSPKESGIDRIGEFVKNATTRGYRPEGMITRDEAKARFGIDISEEMILPETALLRVEDKQKKLKMQEWLNRGPDLGVLGNIAAGAITLLEPLNLVTNFAGGAIFSAFKVKPTFKNLFLENVVETSSVDIPSYFVDKARNQDVEFSQTATNIIGGSLLGTALQRIAIRLSNRTDLDESGFKKAVAQSESNVKIDASSEAAVRTAINSGKTNAPIEAYPYKFEDFSNKRTFYSAISAESGKRVSFETGKTDSLDLPDEALFGAVSLTDNPNVANNFSSFARSDLFGQIEAYSLKDGANLIDLDSRIDADLSRKFISFLETRGMNLPSEVRLSLEASSDFYISFRQLLDLASSDGKKLYLDFLRAENFDGYRYVDMAPDGTKQNKLSVFDPDKLDFVSGEASSNNLIPKIDPSENEDVVRNLGDPSRSNYFDPAVDEEISRNQGLKASGFDDDMKAAQEQKQYAESVLSSLAKEDPALKMEITETAERVKEGRKETSLLKSFFKCVVESLP